MPFRIALSGLNAAQSDLNVTANNPPPNSDAIYLSNGANGFRLSTATSFEIRADYSFAAATAPGAFGRSQVTRDRPIASRSSTARRTGWK